MSITNMSDEANTACNSRDSNKRIEAAKCVIDQISSCHLQARKGGTVIVELKFDKSGLCSRAIVREENVF